MLVDGGGCDADRWQFYYILNTSTTSGNRLRNYPVVIDEVSNCIVDFYDNST
jgi:hypothetical protein